MLYLSRSLSLSLSLYLSLSLSIYMSDLIYPLPPKGSFVKNTAWQIRPA